MDQSQQGQEQERGSAVVRHRDPQGQMADHIGDAKSDLDQKHGPQGESKAPLAAVAGAAKYDDRQGAEIQQQRECPNPVGQVDGRAGGAVQVAEFVVRTDGAPQCEALGEVRRRPPLSAVAGRKLDAGYRCVVGAGPASKQDLSAQEHQPPQAQGRSRVSPADGASGVAPVRRASHQANAKVVMPPARWAVTMVGFTSRVTVHMPSRPWKMTSPTSSQRQGQRQTRRAPARPPPPGPGWRAPDRSPGSGGPFPSMPCGTPLAAPETRRWPRPPPADGSAPRHDHSKPGQSGQPSLRRSDGHRPPSRITARARTVMTAASLEKAVRFTGHGFLRMVRPNNGRGDRRERNGARDQYVATAMAAGPEQ